MHWSKCFVGAIFALLAACGADTGADRRDRAPTVVGGVVGDMVFADTVEGVGTAFANEQTILTSPVTERVERVNFKDGQRVRRGEVIAVLSRAEEVADLKGVEARAREAQQQLDRLRNLQERGFATNAQTDAQLALANAAQADANAIRAQIGDRIIRAPFDGVIGLRRISPGTVVSSGSAIAMVSDISSIKLDFTLPESFLSAVKIGQSIEAKAAAYPDEVFLGNVESIDPNIDSMSRAVTVRARLSNTDARLKPGMLMTVKVVSNPRTALAVPETALIALGEQQYIFRIDKDNIARKTVVETGMRADGMVEIRSGKLAKGDRIVADGTVKTRDDMPVAPVFPGDKADGVVQVSGTPR